MFLNVQALLLKSYAWMVGSLGDPSLRAPVVLIRAQGVLINSRIEKIIFSVDWSEDTFASGFVCFNVRISPLGDQQFLLRKRLFPLLISSLRENICTKQLIYFKVSIYF